MNNRLRLSDVASYSNKRISCKSVDSKDFISVDNMLPNKKGITEAKFTPSGTLIKYEAGDILIGNIRPYLKKIWLADRSGGSSPDVLVLNVKKDYCPKFIYYSLLSDDFFSYAMNGRKGTKMPRGDKSQILDYPISNFDISVQQKIGNVLYSLDEKIKINNEINSQLSLMAKTLYDYWFVQFNFPDKFGKPFKASGGKLIYNDLLKKNIPEHWQTDSLYDIATFTNGLACQKFRPNSDLEDYLPVIKIKEMNEGISDKTERVKVGIPAKQIINDGDVLFSWSASLDVKIWAGGTCGLNQHIFKVHSSKYPKMFYYYEILNHLQHFKMMADVRKTTLGHITKDHLIESKILIPPHNLIEELNKIINPILEKIQLNEKQNLELISVREWLLPLLISGQINVDNIRQPIENSCF